MAAENAKMEPNVVGEVDFATLLRARKNAQILDSSMKTKQDIKVIANSILSQIAVLESNSELTGELRASMMENLIMQIKGSLTLIVKKVEAEPPLKIFTKEGDGVISQEGYEMLKGLREEVVSLSANSQHIDLHAAATGQTAIFQIATRRGTERPPQIDPTAIQPRVETPAPLGRSSSAASDIRLEEKYNSPPNSPVKQAPKKTDTPKESPQKHAPKSSPMKEAAPVPKEQVPKEQEKEQDEKVDLPRADLPLVPPGGGGWKTPAFKVATTGPSKIASAKDFPTLSVAAAQPKFKPSMPDVIVVQKNEFQFAVQIDHVFYEDWSNMLLTMHKPKH